MPSGIYVCGHVVPRKRPLLRIGLGTLAPKPLLQVPCGRRSACSCVTLSSADRTMLCADLQLRAHDQCSSSVLLTEQKSG